MRANPMISGTCFIKVVGLGVVFAIVFGMVGAWFEIGAIPVSLVAGGATGVAIGALSRRRR